MMEFMDGWKRMEEGQMVTWDVPCDRHFEGRSCTRTWQRGLSELSVQ
jgi:hypothetical protein